MYRIWTAIFLIGAFSYTPLAQETNDWITSVSMPPEAAQVVRELRTIDSHPLSDLGRKAVLSRFALFYQEKIIHPLAMKKYQECKESESSRDCEREYMNWYEAGKKESEYKILHQNSDVDWLSSWLTRMGIPTLPDVSSGEVEIRGESKKEHDLFLKWRDANGYTSKNKELDNLEGALYFNVGIQEGQDITSEQAVRIAAMVLEIYWKKASLQEEFMCRYLLTVLGKNPVECLDWRSRGIDVDPVKRDMSQSPEVIVALYPKQFFKLDDMIELYVRVIESDDSIVAGTSVHLVPEGEPEDSEEFLTDSEGIAKITFVHRDETVPIYSYVLYTRGQSIKISLPVFTADRLKNLLENLKSNERPVHPYGETEEELLTAVRTGNGWQVDIVTYDDWINIDEVKTSLREWNLREVRKVGRSRRFRRNYQDIDAAVQALIQLKILLDYTIRE